MSSIKISKDLQRVINEAIKQGFSVEVSIMYDNGNRQITLILEKEDKNG